VRQSLSSFLRTYSHSRGVRDRSLIFGLIFAILFSTPSVLVLCFGVVGTSGNSIFTGALLTVSMAALGPLCFRRNLVLVPADYIFFLFLLTISFSFAFNGQSSNTKECELLALSLSAYPACRLITETDLTIGRPSFIAVSSLIVVLGTVATGFAVFQQWDDPHGKPFVFGFDAAPTYFLQSLSFLILAGVTVGNLTMRRTAIVSALIFLPMAIFAASLVRFTFLALAVSLFVAIFFSGVGQRKHVFVIGAVILLAIATGLTARYAKARLLADYALEQSSGVVTWKRPPSCDLKINPKNSIAIRKALSLDALFLMPRAGWIGTGLDSFMNFSCIKQTEVHNSSLQAAVEFGWMGGALFVLIVVFTGVAILPLARHGGAPLFVLCGLVFVVMLSLAHGRLSRDAVLFALLGTAVGLKETTKSLVLTPSIGR
jgi:hypothetical protein